MSFVLSEMWACVNCRHGHGPRSLESRKPTRVQTAEHQDMNRKLERSRSHQPMLQQAMKAGRPVQLRRGTSGFPFVTSHALVQTLKPLDCR